MRDPRASFLDPSVTKVVDGDLVKVISWYDSEWGLWQSNDSGGTLVEQFY
jgi:glyceraldehyde-3-phosphate dehydrogenase/erythrose-4-phosphate dehydrogenase